MATQWPLVVARLVELLPTLPGWDAVTVFDGAPANVSTSLFATVGHSTDGNTIHSGNYTSTLSLDGFQYVEQGSVICQLATREPGDLGAVRGSMFTLLDQIDAAIRGDRRLGVLSQEGTTSLAVDLSSEQATGTKSYASITFSIEYYTVT